MKIVSVVGARPQFVKCTRRQGDLVILTVPKLIIRAEIPKSSKHIIRI